MVAFTMKLSQAVVDQEHAFVLQGATSTDTLAGLFRTMGTVQGELNLGEPVSSTLSGTTLVVRYSSGGTETYKNVVLDHPGAATGHGSADDYELMQSGVASVFGKGKINFDFKTDGGNVWVLSSTEGATFDTMGAATDKTAGSPGYDAVYGNIGVGMKGNVTLTPQGNMIGSFSNITLYTEKYLDSTSVDGNFYMDTTRTDGVGGVMTGFKQLYQDGSVLQLGGISSTLWKGRLKY